MVQNPGVTKKKDHCRSTQCMHWVKMHALARAFILLLLGFSVEGYYVRSLVRSPVKPKYFKMGRTLLRQGGGADVDTSVIVPTAVERKRPALLSALIAGSLAVSTMVCPPLALADSADQYVREVESKIHRAAVDHNPTDLYK